MKSRFVPLLAIALGSTIAFGALAAEREEDSPWSDWYLKGDFRAKAALSKTRSLLLKGQKAKDGKAAVPNNIHDANARWESYGKQADCTRPEAVNFRTADGTCNDLKGPLVGSAGVAFGRNVPPEFIDQNGDSPEKLNTPNPATVSRAFFKREQFKPIPWLNMLAASWIQFMNHDWLTHGKNMEYDGTPQTAHQVDGVASTAGTVEKTKAHGMPAGAFKREFGTKVTLNDVTHWWDGSQIYGSSQAEQDRIRGIDRARENYVRPTKLIGKIITSVGAQGREVLPLVEGFNKENNRQNQGDELTGFRDNWWVGLSMLHTLFVKEHNAIADELFNKNVDIDPRTGAFTWKNGKATKAMSPNELDEQIFQTARLINAAV
ncbi:MAG TPA: peroxidase family protein, partial [Bdellovibrionota bacterium]|nr:peroxidase family protein [Bdellovibrionota bacterium]